MAINGTAPEAQEGVVEEAFPGMTFKVRLKDSERDVLAHLSGKMKINHIRVMPGNRVLVEMGPDGRRGRIVRRL
jgi:translation initiation factor IF-1